MRHLMVSCCFIIVAVLSGCAAQQPLNTRSGKPEVVFNGASVEDVKGRIADGCMRKGTGVLDVSSNHVVCGGTMSGGDAVLAQMIVGNSYSTTPVRKIQFLLFQRADSVYVTAREWIESQMAFGQVRQQELTATHQLQSVQDFLVSIGGRYE